jgi:hypothetical protein
MPGSTSPEIGMTNTFAGFCWLRAVWPYPQIAIIAMAEMSHPVFGKNRRSSEFTSYPNLSTLTQLGIRFITLRRRGKKLIDNIDNLGPWQRIQIPHAKRKYPKPLVYESMVEMKNYDGQLRQVIIRGNGREKPTFLISNDFETPVEILVGNYSRRWRVENVISEAVNFFNLNMLSSPILIKVHFDVVMTMIADTLYSMLAKKLRGFEDCDAPKIYRDFVRGKGKIAVEGKK